MKINNFQGELTDVSAKKEALVRELPLIHTVNLNHIPMLLFSKLNKVFFGYFDPENILLDNENK